MKGYHFQAGWISTASFKKLYEFANDKHLDSDSLFLSFCF